MLRGCTQEKLVERNKRQAGGDDGHARFGDLWVEFLITVAIAFCMSSAIAFLQNTMMLALKAFVLSS